MSYSVQEVLVNNQDRTRGNDCDFTVELANNRTLDPSYSHVAVSQVATKGVVFNINETNNRLYFAVNVQALKKTMDPSNTNNPTFSVVTATRQGVTRTAENNFTTYVTIPPGSYTPTTLVSMINTLEFPASEEYTNFNLNAPTQTIGDEVVPFFGFYNGIGSDTLTSNTVEVYNLASNLKLTIDYEIPLEKPNFRPFAAYDAVSQKFTFSIVYDSSVTPTTTVQGFSVSKNQFVISEWITAFWGDSATYGISDEHKYFLYPGTAQAKYKASSFFGNFSVTSDADRITAIHEGAFQNIEVVATVIPFFDSNNGNFPALLNLNSDVGFGGSTNFYEGVTYNGGALTNSFTLNYTQLDSTTFTFFTTNITLPAIPSTFSSVDGKGLTYDDSQFYDSYTASFASITLFKTGLSWVLCSNVPRLPIISTNLNLVEGMCMIPCNDTGEYTLTEFVYDHDYEIDPGILRSLHFKVCDLEGNKLDFRGEISILLRFKKLDIFEVHNLVFLRLLLTVGCNESAVLVITSQIKLTNSS